MEEPCYFVTTRGFYVVVKNPEYASEEEMRYIATLYQEFEDALYSGGVNPMTGKTYTEYVDLESMVKCYLINEFTKNRDGFKSSQFFYKDAGQDIMKLGPLWDYDLCLGTGGGNSLLEEVSPEGLWTAATYFGEALCEKPDFCEAVKEIYENEFRPLIQDVVLGDVDAVSADGSLRSLDYYTKIVEKAAMCNSVMWPYEESWEEDIRELREFFALRMDYLDDVFRSWIPGTKPLDAG